MKIKLTTAMIDWREDAKTHIIAGDKTLCGRNLPYSEVWENENVDCNGCIEKLKKLKVIP